MIRVLYHHRKYIVQNAWNDLRHRYAGSGMGVIWNVISPLAQILVFSLIFTKIMMIKLPGVTSEFAFPLFVLGVSAVDCLFRMCYAGCQFLSGKC